MITEMSVRLFAERRSASGISKAKERVNPKKA
jgi:hypothetical protein